MLFARKTVASLTAKLKGIVEDLKAHADEQFALAEGHQAVAAEYARRAGDASQEAQKAAAAAQQIGGLI